MFPHKNKVENVQNNKREEPFFGGFWYSIQIFSINGNQDNFSKIIIQHYQIGHLNTTKMRKIGFKWIKHLNS